MKAFAKDFEKYVEKPGDKGRYVNLDFGQLVELSRLDSVLWALVLELALDVEHYLKVRTNMAAMSCGNDPYAIVESFLEKSATQLTLPPASAVRSVNSILPSLSMTKSAAQAPSFRRGVKPRILG